MRLAARRKPCKPVPAVTMTRHVLVTTSTSLMSTNLQLAAQQLMQRHGLQLPAKQPNSLRCRAAQLSLLPGSPIHIQFCSACCRAAQSTFSSVHIAAGQPKSTFSSVHIAAGQPQSTLSSVHIAAGQPRTHSVLFTLLPGSPIHIQFCSHCCRAAQSTFSSVHIAAGQPNPLSVLFTLLPSSPIHIQFCSHCCRAAQSTFSFVHIAADGLIARPIRHRSNHSRSGVFSVFFEFPRFCFERAFFFNFRETFLTINPNWYNQNAARKRI